MNADSIQYALETDWPVGAAGFEPLHSGIGIRQDSQPGRRDSNLRISKSSKTADLDRQLVASRCSVAVLHHSRCGSSTPAAPTGQSVSNAYGIG